MDIRGRLVILEGCLPHCYVASRPEPNLPIFGLIAVCIPLVMPSHVDASPDEPFLRSKHALNLALCSADSKLMNALEIADDCQLSAYSLYSFADSRDSALVAEAHKQGTITLQYACRLRETFAWESIAPENQLRNETINRREGGLYIASSFYHLISGLSPYQYLIIVSVISSYHFILSVALVLLTPLYTLHFHSEGVCLCARNEMMLSCNAK